MPEADRGRHQCSVYGQWPCFFHGRVAFPPLGESGKVGACLDNRHDAPMPRLAQLIVALLATVLGGASLAADTPLLIQTQSDGSYRLWHTEGETQLQEEELLSLAASAEPGGGPYMDVSAGRARAVELPGAVLVEVPDVPEDKALLLERDACGGIKIWHSAGPARLSEDDMTELVLSALPAGGKRVFIGEDYAKAFSTALGVVTVIWRPVR